MQAMRGRQLRILIKVETSHLSQPKWHRTNPIPFRAQSIPRDGPLRATETNTDDDTVALKTVINDPEIFL
jgi:hypothetical protein